MWSRIAVLICLTASCHAGLLGAGTGAGSCAAAPFRSAVVDWAGGCPVHAPCCSEFGYCRGREEWLAGGFRDCNGESNGRPLEAGAIAAENAAAAAGDFSAANILVVPAGGNTNALVGAPAATVAVAAPAATPLAAAPLAAAPLAATPLAAAPLPATAGFAAVPGVAGIAANGAIISTGLANGAVVGNGFSAANGLLLNGAAGTGFVANAAGGIYGYAANGAAITGYDASGNPIYGSALNAYINPRVGY